MLIILIYLLAIATASIVASIVDMRVIVAIVTHLIAQVDESISISFAAC